MTKPFYEEIMRGGKQREKKIEVRESAMIVVKNDKASYSYLIISKRFDKANDSYNAIINDMDEVQDLLKFSEEIIDDSKIRYTIKPEYEYEPKTKLLGYRTVAKISYKVFLKKNDTNFKKFLIFKMLL